MTYVTTYHPIREGEIIVADMEVIIRPMFEQTFEFGIAADAWFVGRDDCKYVLPEKRAREVLAEIKREAPDVWREIEQAAESNFLGRD